MNERVLVATAELIAALGEMVLRSIDEDDTWAEDHLLFTCLECQASAEDDHMRIPHETNCAVGTATAVLLKTRGQA